MEHRHRLRALQTFEAVSRLLSVADAAQELGVTQSAVSHQLRQLQEVIGERLVQKNGRGISLTDAGRTLARRLQPAFAEIDRSVSESIGGIRGRTRLAVCSSFAPAWLVPRLARFYEAYPWIDLQILMYARDPELTDATGDAFVTTLPKDSGYHAQFLWAERLVPVASRALLRRTGHDGPLNLITTELETGKEGSDWRTYAQESGITEMKPACGHWYYASHYVVARDMVRQGLGAALLPDFLVEDDLRTGDLELLGNACVLTREDYHLCIKQSRRSEPALDALSRWFRREIGFEGEPAAGA